MKAQDIEAKVKALLARLAGREPYAYLFMVVHDVKGKPGGSFDAIATFEDLIDMIVLIMSHLARAMRSKGDVESVVGLTLHRLVIEALRQAEQPYASGSIDVKELKEEDHEYVDHDQGYVFGAQATDVDRARPSDEPESHWQGLDGDIEADFDPPPQE